MRRVVSCLEEMRNQFLDSVKGSELNADEKTLIEKCVLIGAVSFDLFVVIFCSTSCTHGLALSCFCSLKAACVAFPVKEMKKRMKLTTVRMRIERGPNQRKEWICQCLVLLKLTIIQEEGPNMLMAKHSLRLIQPCSISEALC